MLSETRSRTKAQPLDKNSHMEPPFKKRKTITDFYSRASSSAKPSPSTFAPLQTAVPGLTLHKDFVTVTEETKILAFLNSEKCTWRTDLSRKTMHFGGDYCLMPPREPEPSPKRRRNEDAEAPSPDAEAPPMTKKAKPQILQAPAMPAEFGWLIQRMIDRGIYKEDKSPQYCIVNHYTGTLGISAHTENFSFDQPVVGLSLLGSCPMRFHEVESPYDGSVRSGKARLAKRTGRVVDVQLPGRSLLVMNDDARWRWQHEIVRTGKGRGEGWERLSLTFRVKK